MRLKYDRVWKHVIIFKSPIFWRLKWDVRNIRVEKKRALLCYYFSLLPSLGWCQRTSQKHRPGAQHLAFAAAHSASTAFSHTHLPAFVSMHANCNFCLQKGLWKMEMYANRTHRHVNLRAVSVKPKAFRNKQRKKSRVLVQGNALRLRWSLTDHK